MAHANTPDSPQLGQLITTVVNKPERDAIHIAVVPVTARNAMKPGEWINLSSQDDIEHVSHSAQDTAIGIVDPFLKAPVRAGQSFWMFLIPNTITGVRHHWQHPSFTDKIVKDKKDIAHAWIRGFALELGLHPDELYRAAQGKCGGEVSYFVGDREGIGESDPMKWELFWHYFKELEGKMPDDISEGIYFSCAC